MKEIKGENILEIKVLIIDDDETQAFLLKKFISKYKTIIRDQTDSFGKELHITYSCIINGDENVTIDTFDGRLAQSHVRSYLYQSPENFDIVLCDYDLIGKEKGDVMLREIMEVEKKNSLRYFKVLLSTKLDYQNFQHESYIDYTFNSKEQNTVTEILLKYYEEKILHVKLFGNPNWYNSFYDKSERGLSVKDDFNNFKIKKTILLHILVAQTTKKQKSIAYHFINDEWILAESSFAGYLHTLNEHNSFFDLDGSIYFNLLWISDIDLVGNRIKFITPSNKVFEVNLKTFNDKRPISIQDFLSENGLTLDHFKTQSLSKFFKFN